MSSIDTLSAFLREKVGTNSAKKVRIASKVPAIIYGDGKNPEPISLDVKDLRIEILLICCGSIYDGKSVCIDPSISKIAYAWLLIERLPPLIKIFGLPFATLSPITVIPGNLPTIISSRDVAAGEIEKPDEGFETLLFCVPQEQSKTIKSTNV